MIFCPVSLALGDRFAYRLDAFGAQHFMHGAAIFHHERLLQIRFECAIGGALREGAVMTEGCGFATVCAFCHEITSFLAIIPILAAF